MSIFQNDSADAIVMLVERNKLCPFAQFHATRFCIFGQCCDHASAFDETGIRIEEAVLKSIFGEGRETIVKSKIIEAFETVSDFFQDAAAFEFETARLHFLLAHEQNAGLVIKLGPEFGVPFAPNRNA